MFSTPTNQKSQFIKIPAHIIAMENLNLTDKLCLAQIEYLNNDIEKGCTCKNKYLGSWLHKSSRQVQRVIAKLAELGLITCDIKDRFHRSIKIAYKRVEESVEKAQETAKQCTTKCHNMYDKVSGYITNKKNFKYFNKDSNFEFRKKELNLYQYDYENIKEFETRCETREKQGDVIIKRTYIQSKTVSANKFNEMKQKYMKNKGLLLNSTLQSLSLS